MITVTMKDGTVHGNMDGGAERDGQILMIYTEEGLIAEFNDTWSYWYEHEKRIDTIRKEE